ncbi:MAG: hypothetical protein R3C61_02170 [Bacteroidia bacterium]
MNRDRINNLLQKAGCERINFNRDTSSSRFSESIHACGISEDQLRVLELKRKKLIGTLKVTNPKLAVVGTVTLGLQIYKYHKDVQNIEWIVNNWEEVQAAFSIINGIGLSNTAHIAVVLADNWNTISNIAEVQDILGDLAASGFDVVEAGYTLMIGPVLSASTWGLFKIINNQKENRLKELQEKADPILKLRNMLEKGSTPQDIKKQLKFVPSKLI